MVDTLGQVILKRRAELGLTQEQLAERIGVSVRQSEVSRLERDYVALPRRYRLEQIARALDLPLGELLVRSGWAGAEAVDEHTTEAVDEQTTEAEASANHELQSANVALQITNDRLESEAFDHATAMATSVAIVEQLQAILNGLHHPVVVVNRAGLIVLENTAYAVFAATHADAADMVDDDEVPIPGCDVPLERAARGERFAIACGVMADGVHHRFEAYGHPVSTLAGGMLGVVSFEQQTMVASERSQ